MGATNLRLTDALFSKTQRRVLGLLFGHPERSYYANEIVRFAGAGVGAVHRELQGLAAAGLVTATRVGNQIHYRANRDSPIFEELCSIVSKVLGSAARAADRVEVLPGRAKPGAHRAVAVLQQPRAGYDVARVLPSEPSRKKTGGAVPPVRREEAEPVRVRRARGIDAGERRRPDGRVQAGKPGIAVGFSEATRKSSPPCSATAGSNSFRRR